MRSTSRLVVAGLVIGVGLAVASPSFAQATGANIWAKGGCADCHGNLAAGDGDPAYPQGPNLRRTALQRADLREAIAGGRPGTDMPYHAAGAYTAATPCFGITAGVPPATRKGGALSVQDLDTLVEFLLTSVKGQARITRANCALFNGGDLEAPACAEFPR